MTQLIHHHHHHHHRIHIHHLPRELLLAIIEDAVSSPSASSRGKISGKTYSRTLFSLALVSLPVSQLVDYILYHSLTITTPRQLKLLSRTASTSHGANRLSRSVENLCVASIKYYPGRDEHVAIILSAVPHLQKVGLDQSVVGALDIYLRDKNRNRYAIPTDALQPTHLTISSMTALGEPILNSELLREITHLTFPIPSEKWIAPLPFLLSLPLSYAPSRLTHLTLSRKEHSNSENDILFSTLLSDLLSPDAPLQFRGLERVTVSIYPASPALPSDPGAEIWSLLLPLASVHPKQVRIRLGSWEADNWIEEWEGEVRGQLL